MEIILSNTLSRKKEVFKPIKKNEVKIYVCGITPYDYAHLGHGRVYVTFDVLVRLFKFLGYKVTYVRNVTDIDDKLINKALKEYNDIYEYKQVAQTFTEFFKQDLQKLNCLRPDIEPKVTDHIEDIIKYVQELVENKKAYVIDGDVYFDISTFKPYGKLSGKNLDDLQAGARVEADERKKNPADFALWKGNDKQEFWKSCFGYGRPGWHIECSVMAKKHLGKNIDIHGGGQDLIFPHHENEIAQSESLQDCNFANYWMHNAFLNINKEKMSKSLGNFFTLRDIFEKFDPMVLRFYFLQHHYKTPIEFCFDDLQAAEVAYKKIIKAFGSLEDIKLLKNQNEEILQEILQSLCDDLNTPKALGIIFKNLDIIETNKDLALSIKNILKNILGLTLEFLKEKEQVLTLEIEELIKQREKARVEKNWALSDQLRDKLKDLGYTVQDKKLK